ncbi:hypothetical protein JCM11641_003892 [Rhodosporidiobolus odoratus]
MPSIEPSSPPPRPRRRRPHRKRTAVPADDRTTSPRLATPFHGRVRSRQSIQDHVGNGGQGVLQPQDEVDVGSEGLERGVEMGGESSEQGLASKDKVVDSREGHLPSQALRRPVNPLRRQLNVVPTTSSSSSSALAFPPAAQPVPAATDSLFTIFTTTSASSSDKAGEDAPQAPAPAPIPPPPPADANLLSPATRLHTRRGSTHSRLPDPMWAARVLSPIVRAEVAQAEERKQAAKKGKGKGKEKQREPEAGGADSVEEATGAKHGEPASLDDFLANVLPRTKSRQQLDVKKAKKATKQGQVKGKRGATEEISRKASKRARRSYTSSEREDDDAGPSSSFPLLDPADFYEPPPTPKPLYNATAFLGAMDLAGATSKDKTRLLRQPPYKTPGGRGGKMKLSLDAPSRTSFGKEGRDSSGAKGRQEADKESVDGVKRLKPGEDLRTPFLQRISQTAFAPLVGREGERKRKEKADMKSMLALDEEIDKIAEEVAKQEPVKSTTAGAKKLARVTRRGGGKVTALELGGADDAGAVGELNIELPRPPHEPQVKPPPKKKPTVARRPPTAKVKYRFEAVRLPPPRLLNPQLVPVPSKQSVVLGQSRAGDDAATPSFEVPIENVNEAVSEANLPPQARKKLPHTNFRFVVGPKANKAPTVEARQALAKSSSSAAPARTTTRSLFASPPPAQADISSSTRTSTSARAPRKRSYAFVTPGNLGRSKTDFDKADSDPEGKAKRKKRSILRRLSTRPEFYLPSSIIEEDETKVSGTSVHRSSHEYTGDRSGRPVSLPPELGSRSRRDDEGESPSKRPVPVLPASPERFAAALPQARQSASLPKASGYLQQCSSPSRHQGQQAVEAHSNPPDKVGNASAARSDQLQPLIIRSDTSTSRLHLNAEVHPTSSASSSPLWSRVPSFRQKSVEPYYPYASDETVRRTGESGLVSPYEGPSHISETPEEQPPASVLAGEEAGVEESYSGGSNSETSLASRADIRKLPSYHPFTTAAARVQPAAAAGELGGRKRRFESEGDD